MPRTISSFGILEKNKLTSSAVWLVALEITIPGVAEPVRVIRNNESVTWRGETWIAFPFELDEIGEESKGEVPQVELRVSNVNRVFEAYLADYDLYTKTNGYTPIEVRIYVVLNQSTVAGGVITDTTSWGAVTDTASSGALTDTLIDLGDWDYEVEHLFELKSPRTDSMWATFTLGAANPFSRRFPQGRMLKNHCRFQFKSVLCGYSGGETVCDKTLTRCRELSNSTRFGGFPGVGQRGLTLVR